MDIQINNGVVVVFDLDDTLYNEIDFLKSAYLSISRFLEPDTWKPLFAQMFSLYRNRADVFDWLATIYPISKTELIEKYRSHYPNIKLFPGVMEVLSAIKEKGGHLGILTDGRAQTQRNKIEALGLMQIIDLIGISEELGSEKPALKNFRYFMDHFKGEEYYYVADNLKKDFITPNTLGWNTMGLIDNGLNIHAELHVHWNIEEQRPRHFFTDYSELRII